MARFDVYDNPVLADRRHTPFVLDVQNDHLKALGSRVVVPLRTRASVPVPIKDLQPELTIDRKIVVMDTANLAPTPTLYLRKVVATVQAERLDVLNALDSLFGSY
jgi:toxin CcdB